MNLLDDKDFGGVADEIASLLKRRKFSQCVWDGRLADLFCPANLGAWKLCGLLADRCEEAGSDKAWASVGLSRIVTLRLLPVYVEEEVSVPFRSPPKPDVPSWCWMSTDSPKAAGCRLSVKMCKEIQALGDYKLEGLRGNKQSIVSCWENRVLHHKTIVTALLAAAGALAKMTDAEVVKASYAKVKNYHPQNDIGLSPELSQLSNIDHGN